MHHPESNASMTENDSPPRRLIELMLDSRVKPPSALLI